MLNENQPSRSFERYIAALLIFCIVHGIAATFTIELPVGLLYGPLVYMAYKSATGNPVQHGQIHLFPFLSFLFIYAISYFGSAEAVGWASGLSIFYLTGYKIIMALSIITYSILCIIKNKNGNEGKLISVSSFLIFAFALLNLFMTFNKTSYSLMASQIIIYSFAGLMICTILLYFYINKTANDDNIEDNDVKEFNFVQVEADEVQQKLHQCLEESKLYLNAGLTLDILAQRADLSRHRLSYFLNNYIGKSFYRLIAEYRIEYAKKRLEEDNFVTIESLAYECGFYSKTTLNKYFKELTGIAPSQYRVNLYKDLS